MVAWRYEISLRVLKNISRVSAVIFFNTRREILYISMQPCNILYLSFVFPEDMQALVVMKKQTKKIHVGILLRIVMVSPGTNLVKSHESQLKKV